MVHDGIGYIQVYTGNSKGKTTASLGLTLRALGHGWKVLLAQFMKGEGLWSYGEITSLGCYSKQLDIRQYGLNMLGVTTVEDLEALQAGWLECKSAIASNQYDLIILDELNLLTYNNVIETIDVVKTLKNKPQHLEIVLTGRQANPEIIKTADLVTEMVCRKHYFDQGVLAREGIEY